MILPLLGLIFGSYVTALSWRIPRGISNVKGRSFCDYCKNNIAWYDNIPLISYIILGGKCRFCKKKISIRYPLIEIISAIGFYLIGWNIFNLSLFVILLAIFVIDFEHQIIPDEFVYIGIFIAMLINSKYLLANLVAGFLAATFLLLIHLFTKGRGMGLGDVKFAVLGGFMVGLTYLPVWLFVAFLTGGVVGFILVLGRFARLKDRIAFGPFLIISIPVALIWGEKLIKLLRL